ncbi:MAG: DNA repair protein RecN [Jejuia sp.]
MLKSLSIKNYALIDALNVDFNNGFTIITGETGTGKSILLGGLSLILGKRADLSSLKNKEIKCIIEAVFDISKYNLKTLFEVEDLDYESNTIIRREILPSGKSRAFINDSPVNLSSLQQLGNKLIDMHSQHQTLELTKDNFQFQVIDALANNFEILETYTALLSEYKQLKNELSDLLNLKSDAIKEHDYNVFLLNELNEANLVKDELEDLEEEYETLNNIEEIQAHLSEAYQLFTDEQIGAISILTNLKHNFQKLSSLSSKYEDLLERINSSIIEIDDIFNEVSMHQDTIDADPKRLEIVSSKLQILNNLFQKHQVTTIEELIQIREELSEKVSVTENLDEAISDREKEISTRESKLNDLANSIHSNRNKAIPILIAQLKDILNDLGMPNAEFDIQLQLGESFLFNGKDELSFLFSANKGGSFNTLKKAASGGELSRIMLAIKLILSRYTQLPTIMFDEIDTGVSGEISHKMGDIMLQMSKTMQVFSITHLPQIAAKGHSHFKVYKEDKDNITQTNLILLNQDNRIVEIAQMLGGSELSTSAIAHAKELLN